MKNFLVFIVFFVTGHLVFAQSETIRKFRDKYNETGKYITFSSKDGLLNLIADIDTNDPDAMEFVSFVNSIHSLSFFTIDRTISDFSDQKFNELKRNLNKEGFEDMMMVKDGNHSMQVVVKDNEKTIKELVLCDFNKEKLILISLSGSMELQYISKFIKAIHAKD